MKTIKELNERAWYRFLKVLYIALYVLYGGTLIFGIVTFGREYHQPRPVEETGPWEKYKPVEETGPWTKYARMRTQQQKTFNYSDYYTWKIKDIFYYSVIFSIGFVLIMESVRRSFYYIVLGKVFPRKEALP